jgi:hypothetical protein
MKKYSIILILTFYYQVVCAQNNTENIIGEKIPFKLFNNHIYLQARINHSKPLWFVLDTGAGDILDPKHAKSLNLVLYSSGPTSGSGEGLQDAAITKNVSFQIQNKNFTQAEVAVIALQEVEDCANKIAVDSTGKITVLENTPGDTDQYQPMDGVLGFGFFKNFVVEINYNQQFLTLYDPATYHYQGNGKVIPIVINGNHIFINASVKKTDGVDINGRFMIDTGLMLAVTLNTAFIEKNNLLPPPGQTTAFSICGLGGTSKAQMGTLPGLFFQHIYIDKPRTLFSQATGGVLSSTEFDGLIGNAILRRFKVIFDYSNKQMIVE